MRSGRVYWRTRAATVLERADQTAGAERPYPLADIVRRMVKVRLMYEDKHDDAQARILLRGEYKFFTGKRVDFQGAIHASTAGDLVAFISCAAFFGFWDVGAVDRAIDLLTERVDTLGPVELCHLAQDLPRVRKQRSPLMRAVLRRMARDDAQIVRDLGMEDHLELLEHAVGPAAPARFLLALLECVGPALADLAAADCVRYVEAVAQLAHASNASPDAPHAIPEGMRELALAARDRVVELIRVECDPAATYQANSEGGEAGQADAPLACTGIVALVDALAVLGLLDSLTLDALLEAFVARLPPHNSPTSGVAPPSARETALMLDRVAMLIVAGTAREIDLLTLLPSVEPYLVDILPTATPSDLQMLLTALTDAACAAARREYAAAAAAASGEEGLVSQSHGDADNIAAAAASGQLALGRLLSEALDHTHLLSVQRQEPWAPQALRGGIIALARLAAVGDLQSATQAAHIMIASTATPAISRGGTGSDDVGDHQHHHPRRANSGADGRVFLTAPQLRQMHAVSQALCGRLITAAPSLRADECVEFLQAAMTPSFRRFALEAAVSAVARRLAEIVEDLQPAEAGSLLMSVGETLQSLGATSSSALASGSRGVIRGTLMPALRRRAGILDAQ